MKKVLASVLAGTMVLGMAAAASAASTLTLKDAKSSEYDYQLFLYEPDGAYSTSSDAYAWETETADAFKAYEKEYNKFKKLGTDPVKITAYFNNAATAGADTVVDKYLDFYSLVQTDAKINGAWSIQAVASGGVQANTSTAKDIYAFISANADTTIASLYVAGTSEISAADARAISRMFNANGNSSNNDMTPDAIMKKVTKKPNLSVGSGEYQFENKDYIDISDEGDMKSFGLDAHHMYTYGEDDAKEVKFQVVVEHGEDFRVDVASGKVTVSRKRVEANTDDNTDTYVVSLKAAAGVRDFELDDFKVELDLHDANLVFYIQGDVAYSDYREVLPDDRYIITKSNKDDLHNDGCVFDFSEVIDEETRIVCNDYVDLLFKGNYGTDFENLRVMTDDINEVEDFFQDYDIDYYDFIGTPKFAKDITVRIDADSDAYIYEYDKKTGDVVDITDECEYTSDGMTFKRKSLKTYVVLEEPYEGGNVKAEKEPVSEEPDDTDEPEPETPDDKDATGSKPNPGTGAYPLF